MLVGGGPIWCLGGLTKCVGDNREKVKQLRSDSTPCCIIARFLEIHENGCTGNKRLYQLMIPLPAPIVIIRLNTKTDFLLFLSMALW